MKYFNLTMFVLNLAMAILLVDQVSPILTIFNSFIAGGCLIAAIIQFIEES